MNRAGLSYRAPASIAKSMTIRKLPTVLLKFDGLAFCPKVAAQARQSYLLILRTSVSSNPGQDLSNAAIRSSGILCFVVLTNCLCQTIAKHGKRIAKRHISICDCPLNFNPLAFDFFQIRQPELGDGLAYSF